MSFFSLLLDQAPISGGIQVTFVHMSCPNHKA